MMAVDDNNKPTSGSEVIVKNKSLKKYENIFLGQGPPRQMADEHASIIYFTIKVSFP